MTDDSSPFISASLADFSAQTGRRSRPRLFLRLFFLFLALVGITGITLFLWQRGRTAPSARTAVLTELQGQVEWRTGDTSDWQVAELGTELHAGDQVRTSAGATALITYFEGSITRLGVETTVELTDLSARPDNRWTSITFTQLSGHTDQLVLPLPSEDSRFEVTTAAAIIRVRGTAYQITVAENGDTQVEVTQGQVLVTSGSDEHTLTSGDRLLIPFTLLEGGDGDPSQTPTATIPPATPVATLTTLPTFTPLATGTVTTTVTPTTTPIPTTSVTPTRPNQTTVTLPPVTASLVATLGATATLSLPTPQPTAHENEDEDEDEDEDDND